MTAEFFEGNKIVKFHRKKEKRKKGEQEFSRGNISLVKKLNEERTRVRGIAGEISERANPG